ncbi:DUF11 domain-containing protein [Patescibacteria group bacterium]|nr:DUF11 domain-containing protein [Patescibacteria group bacterium]
MKNAFKLRFRKRKILVALGVMVTAVALAPLIQTVNAAAVNLDMDLASRLVTGPNSPTQFKDSLAVQHGNVVESQIVVHNTEDAYNGPTAQDYKIHLTAPKTVATTAAIQASVTASNAASNATFKTSESNNYTSANGRPFVLSKPRNFVIQRNNVADDKCNVANFNFGQSSDIPAGRIQVTETANSYEFVIDPNGDNQLKPSFCQALRLGFLTDVNQGPNITINKQVRETGQTVWQEGPIGSSKDKELEYLVSVKNTGDNQATNVVIRDALPPYVSLVPDSCKMYVGTTPEQVCSDNFVQGGLKFTFIDPASAIYVKFKAKADQLPQNFCKTTNAAMVKTDQAPEVNDTASVNYVCTQASPTPTPTPSPTPPTPTPTPTPTETPTSTPTVPPETPPAPPPNTPKTPPTTTGVLPVTGTSSMGLLALLATMISGYLYYRARQAHRKASARSSKK